MQADTIELYGLVSAGEFSSVFHAQRNHAGPLHVVKCFRKATASGTASSYQRVWRERSNSAGLALLPHPFIIRHLYSAQNGTFLFLGMENVGGGDVFTLLQQRGPLAPELARVYAAEVSLALGHVHSFDVVFRDLKPENVLLALDGHAKLADFGSSKQMVGRVNADVPPPAEVHSLCGTPEYMAPEVLLGHPSCETCDWWSLGCFVAELLCGATPFAESNQAVHQLVRKILHEDIAVPEHPNIGAAETEFLLALLVREPLERLGARAQGGHRAILAHPWFENVPIASYLRKEQPVAWLPIDITPAQLETDAELEAMAANHGRGMHTLLSPAPINRLDTFEAWGPEVRLVIGSAPDEAAAAASSTDEVVKTDEANIKEATEEDDREDEKASQATNADGSFVDSSPECVMDLRTSLARDSDGVACDGFGHSAPSHHGRTSPNAPTLRLSPRSGREAALRGFDRLASER